MYCMKFVKNKKHYFNQSFYNTNFQKNSTQGPRNFRTSSLALADFEAFITSPALPYPNIVINGRSLMDNAMDTCLLINQSHIQYIDQHEHKNHSTYSPLRKFFLQGA
jgi:hypothetical protein